MLFNHACLKSIEEMVQNQGEGIRNGCGGDMSREQTVEGEIWAPTTGEIYGCLLQNKGLVTDKKQHSNINAGSYFIYIKLLCCDSLWEYLTYHYEQQFRWVCVHMHVYTRTHTHASASSTSPCLLYDIFPI